jgi:hypothetical protein
MMNTLKWIVLAAIVAAAVCVPIVILTHRSLMPDSAQLSKLDTAARDAAPPGSTVRRLRAPDRVESDGHAKFGYFTYEVSEKGTTDRYRADWRIEDGHVQLISFKRL